MRTRWFRLSLILMILITPFGNAPESASASTVQPPAETATSPMLAMRSHAVAALGADAAVNDPTGDSASLTQNGAVVAYNETNGVLCAAYVDSYHGVVQGTGFTGFSSSTDGGATWVDRGALDANSLGYPTLVWRRASNRFYLATLHSDGLGVWDLGARCESATWKEMVHSGANDDRATLAVDNTSGPYAGRLYAVWTDHSDGRIYVARSESGALWATPVDVSQHNQVNGAWPAVDPATGDVYVAWTHWDVFPDGPIDIEIARSTDGGATWTPLANPMDNRVNPRDAAATAACERPALKGNLRHSPFPQLAAGQDGVLHVVYVYDPDGYGEGDIVNVYYRRSTDRGATWEPEIQVNDNTNATDQFSPALAVAETGDIAVFWYDRRLDSADNLLYDRYGAVSHDNGQSFGRNWRVSDESSAVVAGDTGLAACYHGDYDGAAAGGGYFYTVWGDDRRGNADVWFDSEPYTWGNLVGTVYDAATRHGLPDAWVGTVHRTTGTPYSGAGDVGGAYSLPVPGGEIYTVTAQVYGYAPNSVTAIVGADGGHADIPLTPVSHWAINGKVVDAHTGSPLRAHGTVSGVPLDPPAPHNETWSDPATGRYQLPGLAAKIPYTLTVAAPGYVTRVYFAGELAANRALPDLALQPDWATCSAPGYEWAEVFYDGFESGALGPAWSTSVMTNGQVSVTTGYPYAGNYSVLLDARSSGSYSQAALDVTQDLSQLDNVTLDFWWRGFGDENDPQDGVFISDDGASWRPVLSFGAGENDFRNDQVDIAGAAAAHGLSLDNPFRIRFQFYDDYPIPDDGYAVDEVRLKTCQLTTGAALSPGLLKVDGCSGIPQTHTLTFVNRSGVSGEVVLTASAGLGATVLDIPASLGVVSNNTARSFAAQVHIDEGVSLNTPVYLTVTARMASNPALSDTVVIEKHAALLEQSWEMEPDRPAAAFQRGASATVDDAVYVIGGQGSLNQTLSYTGRYRPGSGWETLDDKPTAAAIMDAAELDGKIYVAGGYGGGRYLSNFEALDPAQPSGAQWTALTATLPVATSGGGLASACDKIYLMGGNPNAETPTAAVYVYDPADPGAGWVAAGNMPAPQRYATAVTARGLIFLVGDKDAGARVQVYNCAANAWVSGYPQLRAERQSPGVAVVHNRYLVAFGGSPAASSAGSATVEILDLDNLAAGWQAGPPLNQKRMGPGGGVAGGKLIVAGGAGAEGTASSAVESIALCPACADGAGVAKNGPEWAYTGDVVPYTLGITHSEWLTGAVNLADRLPPGLNFAGGLNASSGTAWYSDTARAVYWTAALPAPGATTPGALLETFTHTWATNGAGLDYNPDKGILRYTHESDAAHYLNDVSLSGAHPVLHRLTLSQINPGWPAGLNAHTGIGYDVTTGHYFLVDYSGGSGRSDNIVEIDATGRVLNAWELSGAGNDSYDGAEINSLVDIAIAPGSPARFFVTRLLDGGKVYEVDLIRTGQFVEDSWGELKTCTVPGIDTAGIDYDAQNGVLYHSGWNSNAIVVTDLSCNVLATFTCGAPDASNTGIAFIERRWPPEVWALDYNHNTTTRCSAPGSLPRTGNVTVAFNATVAAQAPATLTNAATLDYAGSMRVAEHALSVAPRAAITWTKEVYINGHDLGRYAAGPFTVAPNDDVQIVDELRYAGRAPLFVRLAEDWHGHPVTLVAEDHSRGVIAGGDGDWYATLPPNSAARLVRTLHITAAATPITISQQLQPTGLPPEERSLAFQAPVFVKDGPSVAYNGQPVTYTLAYQSLNPLVGPLYLTDALSSGVKFTGPVTASYGVAYFDEADNAIYWSNAPEGERARRRAAALATLPASVAITFTVEVTAGAGARIHNAAQMNVHGAILTADRPFDVPLPAWQKRVNGVPWQPGFNITVADGELLTVTDVVTTPSAFTLREMWHSNRLELVDYAAPQGQLRQIVGGAAFGDGVLEWRVPFRAMQPLTLTKIFRVRPDQWPPTVLSETLSIGDWSRAQPVIIKKQSQTVYTLTIATSGSGSGIVTPTVGQYYHLFGAAVALTATANPGSTFVGWAGDIGGTSPTVTVTMDDNKTAAAVFNLEGVCVDVTGVALTLLTAGDYYTDTAVQFRAAVSPTIAIPYTYTVNYGEGASAPATTLNNPLTLRHTFPTTGSQSVIFEAWSCAMTAPISASLPVAIVERPDVRQAVYLPMVLRAFIP